MPAYIKKRIVYSEHRCHGAIPRHPTRPEDAKMNKGELITAIAAKTEQPKSKVAATLEAFADSIGEALKKGDKVAWAGFGTFSVVKRSARKGRNPQTGKEMKIKASKAPKFKPGKSLKDKIR
jgi:DNA-binding protein HU-beta